MHVVQANCGMVTNVELLRTLEEKRDSGDRMTEIDKHLLGILRSIVPTVFRGPQGSEICREYQAVMQYHNLKPREQLQLFNHAPSMDLELYLMIENCAARFPGSAVTNLLVDLTQALAGKRPSERYKSQVTLPVLSTTASSTSMDTPLPESPEMWHGIRRLSKNDWGTTTPPTEDTCKFIPTGVHPAEMQPLAKCSVTEFFPDSDFEIKLTEHTGYGLFTRKDLPAGKPIIPFCGQVTVNSPHNMYTARMVIDTPTAPLCFFIDAERTGGVARFINHACEGKNNVSTCVLWVTEWNEPALIVCSRCEIPANTEILLDYSVTIISDNPKDQSIPCQCGSVSCKKTLCPTTSASLPQAQTQVSIPPPTHKHHHHKRRL
ncbi:hypothetical protein Pelo_12646 [Pelomyxa schiedti]|nr:hypothetical protein Pelo_12646 [Pelomyxa schiedti]